jgi:peptide/nickel transport system permease protein
VLTYALRRLLQAVPVVFLASVAVFLLIHLIPGDPAEVVAGMSASPQVLSAIRQDMGLDQPLPVQYVKWVSRVARGDLGTSYSNRLPVSQLVGQRIPATLVLTLAAFLLTLVIAIPTGILAAVYQRGPADWLISSFNGLALAVPNFWFGILAIMLFALVLGWLPPGGLPDFTRDPGQGLKYLILPALTLALQSAAGVSRQIKASMLDVLYDDYVRTARAKGLSRGAVLMGHALRNALVPVITLLGLQVGRLLGGAVIVESVFAWPGLGSLTLDALGNRDYTVVQAALLLLIMSFIVVNLITDLLYGVLDPRIRLSGRRAR